MLSWKEIEIPPDECKELSVLQTIMDNESCDVSTQTIMTSGSHHEILTSPEVNQRKNRSASYKPSSRKKSSFRLFIVPDSPKSNLVEDSGLRLSFNEECRDRSNGQSLRFSITSNYENETSDDSHDCGDIEKNRQGRKSRNTFKQKEPSRKSTAVSLKKGSSDAATIDHHLMHSTNPSVLAWLRLKNFEDREKRRLKKQEKIEARQHAYEEAGKKQKRIEESEKRFAQWLQIKKKEARHAWREKRTRKRVDVVERADMHNKDNDAPPNYTVVPTFKGTKTWGSEDALFNIESTSTNIKSADNEIKTVSHQSKITEPSQLLQSQWSTDHQNQSTNGCINDNYIHDQVGLDKNSSGNYNTRPASAHSKLVSVNISDSKLPNSSAEEPRQDQKSKNKRPCTSRGRRIQTTDSTNIHKKKPGLTYEAWGEQKRKEQKEKRSTSRSSDLNFADCKKTSKKVITFEAWKAKKRQESKEKKKQRKRENVDDALTQAITNMARRRVENSYKERKQLDTGMPKWRARNNSTAKQYTHTKYAVNQSLGDNKHDGREKKETHSQAKEVAAIWKYCENLKLD